MNKIKKIILNYINDNSNQLLYYHQLPFKDFKPIKKRHSFFLIDDFRLYNPLERINKLSSPIEELLFYAIYASFINSKYEFILSMYSIWPQVKIPQTKYRVDFLIINHWFKKTLGINIPMFAIETDGHEFHEKTKEQVMRDRERDRDLFLMGLPVIRFSGSEIWRNPVKCAKNAIDCMLRYEAMICGINFFELLGEEEE